MKNEKKYISLIEQLYHEKVQISKPECTGIVHQIYIAKSSTHKMVYRFSEKSCAFNNFRVSQILKEYGIPVPQTNVYRFDGEYCEVYPFIEGMTLHEKLLKQQISENDLRLIFKQLVDFALKISNIPLNNFEHYHLPHMHVFLVDCLFNFIQPYSRKLCHTDLNAKNIVIDNNNKIVGLLDLDSVHPANFNTMFARICLCAKQYGFDEKEIYNMYPQNHNKSIYKMLNIEKQFVLYNNIAKTYCKISKRPYFFNNILKNHSM